MFVPLMALAEPEPPILGVVAVDPVALVRSGEEVPGLESLRLVRHGWEFRFASPENRSEFLRTPEKFLPAQGGACGRMGPLSGYGRGDLYAVHDGRLWLFASPGCRSGFLANPAAMTDPVAPKPRPSAEAQKAARRMVEAAGGAAWARASIRLESYMRVRSGGRLNGQEKLLAWSAGGEVGLTDSWDGRAYAYTAEAGHGRYSSPQGSFDLSLDQVGALRRSMARSPIGLLKGLAEGRAVASGVEGRGVEIWLDGAAIQAEAAPDGRLAGMKFLGWNSNLNVAPVTVSAIEWAEKEGLWVPSAWTEKRGDDEPIRRTWQRVRVAR